MSKYIEVEKPFLDKLRQLNWEVHDQGQGIPQEREKSLRENFKQVLLPKVFTPFLFPHNYSCDLLSKCIFDKRENNYCQVVHRHQEVVICFQNVSLTKEKTTLVEFFGAEAVL